MAKIEDTDFLLPPDFTVKSKNALETSLPLGKLGEGRTAAEDTECSIRGRWFSLYPRVHGGDWTARVPAPLAWNRQNLSSHIQEEWERFLARVRDLRARGCITPRGYGMATHWTAESLAVPARMVPFFRDPLGREGFVDLRPGMRLFVERSVFRTRSAETVANYLGETRTYYTVTRRHNGKLGLKLSKIQSSGSLSAETLEEFPDATLAGTFTGMGALRLISLTLFVPPNLKRNALLVGVRDADEMMGVLQRVEKDPGIPCRDLASAGVACAVFKGMVSASPWLNIWVNNKEEYVPAGSTLDSFGKSYPPPDWAEIWKTLRIWRLFRGKRYELDFNRTDPEARFLVLFAGDRIIWRHDFGPH